jgi:hypothetical protein
LSGLLSAERHVRKKARVRVIRKATKQEKVRARLPDENRNGRVADDAGLVDHHDRRNTREAGACGLDQGRPVGISSGRGAGAHPVNRKLVQRRVDRRDGAREMIAEDEGESLGTALPVGQQFMAIEQRAERDDRCQDEKRAGEQDEHRRAQPIRGASGME